MPIDINKFEAASDEDLRSDSGQSKYDQILEYLAFNPNKAYSREEIQSATGITGLDLISVLSRLEREGRVRHKGSYWAIAPEFEREPAEADRV